MNIKVCEMFFNKTKTGIVTTNGYGYFFGLTATLHVFLASLVDVGSGGAI